MACTANEYDYGAAIVNERIGIRKKIADESGRRHSSVALLTMREQELLRFQQGST